MGIGVGVAAATVAGVAGVAIDRLWRDREHALALGSDEDFTIEPEESLVVIADDGVPLHVEIDDPAESDASRPTVVLSHGYTLDLRCWVYQRRALKDAGYRVVSWDQRGHGSSGKGEHSTYNVDQLGSDLRAVIDAAAPEGDLVLIGHSMGGMTVMALAEADRDFVAERVRGVGFISTSAGGLHRVTWGLGSLLGGAVNRIGPLAMSRLAGYQNIVDSALRGGKDVQEFLVARSSFASPVSMSVVRLTADMIFGTSMEVMSAYIPGLNRHDKLEALAHLNGIEVLVLNGDHDVLTSPLHSDEIVEALPGSEHVLVADAGHIITLEHPEVVSSQILDLLTRAERGGQRSARGRPQVRTTITDLTKKRRDRSSRPVRRRSSTEPRVGSRRS